MKFNPEFMKIIEITNKMLYNNVCKSKLQNQIMKDIEYISSQDVFQELKEAICDGIQSGIAEDFDPETHLKSLRKNYNNV